MSLQCTQHATRLAAGKAEPSIKDGLRILKRQGVGPSLQMLPGAAEIHASKPCTASGTAQGGLHWHALRDSTAMHGTADMGSRCWQSTCVCGHPTVSMFITCRLRDREASRHSEWMQLAPATRSSALISPPASSCSMTHYFSQGLHITCEAPLKAQGLHLGES